MRALNEVRGTSFNQLIKIIKGIARRKDTTLRGEETSKILHKIRELVDSISFLMKDHPYHIPVILYHLSSITSKIKPPRSQECVSRMGEKSNKNTYNSCKTCNGVCKDVYVNFVDVMRDNLVYLSPKGLSQVLSIYSECKNGEICKIVAEIKLRICYFIYCRCKNVNKNDFKDDIDAIVNQYLVVFDEYTGMKLHKDDYLVNFINFGSLGSEEVAKHSSYYLPLNLMDICVTLESIVSSHGVNRNELPYGSNNNNINNNVSNISNSNNRNNNNSNNSLMNQMIVKLSFKLLMYHSFSKRDSLEQFNFLNKFDLDSVCRLIGLFKRFKYRDESIFDMIVEILNKNIEHLDFRNLVTLLDSFSVLSELVNRKNSNDIDCNSRDLVSDSSCDSICYHEDDDSLVSNLYSKLDFKSIASRIESLTKVDSPDYLRSLSTINQVINRINKCVDIPDYEDLIDTVKQSLIRYVSNNANELKNTRAISAIAILLSNIQEPEVIAMVSEAILEDSITFDRRNLYDYSVIIDVLSKNYQKYTKYTPTDNSTNSNGNSNSDGSSYNGYDNLYSTNDLYPINNTLDLCKLYTSICLIVSKCSLYYFGVLEEYLSRSSESVDHGVNLSRMPLREMCYFLVNLELFNRLQSVDNVFLNDCKINIAALTKNLECFFTRYHTRLCEMDHYQISNYLSQIS
ncbi:hypothetical protein MACK_001231 [Theileria orientalis]|uniref:Uncharacterized protein n=1 Tax=Theileria orientalis TaxID=68886 RepID=A0A976MCG4_THEOR|nr:hypothetical protein MACK_001231 [Theileria orientalis]